MDVLLWVPEITHAGFLPRQLNGLLRSAQGIFRPAGSRTRQAAMVALMKQSTITTSTTTTTSSPLQQRQQPTDDQSAVSPAAAPPINMAALMEEMSQQFAASRKSPTALNPTDLVGQLAISFDQKGKESLPGSGDIVAQISGMLPMILSVAKPVMNSYKGTDGYGGFMTVLQDAKQVISNRQVIRQLNQFLDDLIVGDATSQSQTPPTPSDSSLNSLAQIAQNMESLFNVPQSRPKYNRGKGKAVPDIDSANEVVTDSSEEPT